MKRLETGLQASVLQTMKNVLYAGAGLIYNKSHVPGIVEFSRRIPSSRDVDLREVAHEVLREISSKNPTVFKAHLKTLCSILQEQSPSKGGSVESSIVDTMKACAQFAKLHQKEFPQDRKLFQALVGYVLNGDNHRTAKHAVTIIMSTATRKEMYAGDLIKECLKDFKYGNSTFLARLGGIAQLALMARDQVADHEDKIADICKDIITQVRTPVDEENNVKWVSDDNLDQECLAKMLALKILVNRVLANSDTTKIAEYSKHVFTLLNNLIAKEGEISKSKETPLSHQAWLRLSAAKLYLKMARIPKLESLIGPTIFNRLSLRIQDQLPQIRRRFVDKLKKYLTAGKLNTKYYTMLFLIAHEPTQEMREDCKKWLRQRAQIDRQLNSPRLEEVFPRLLSLLAHHADFKPDPEDLLDSAKYIVFYLETVAVEENISLIYHLAQRVKQVQDNIDARKSDNLYVLSDLAQALIQRYEQMKDWSMQPWPKKVGLPAALFGSLSSAEKAHEIAQKNYLPEGFENQLGGLLKPKQSKKVNSPHPYHHFHTNASPA